MAPFGRHKINRIRYILIITQRRTKMITIMVLIFLIVVYAYGRFYLALIEDDNLNEDITIDDTMMTKEQLIKVKEQLNKMER